MEAVAGRHVGALNAAVQVLRDPYSAAIDHAVAEPAIQLGFGFEGLGGCARNL
jgi:hypothetical protein